MPPLRRLLLPLAGAAKQRRNDELNDAAPRPALRHDCSLDLQALPGTGEEP